MVHMTAINLFYSQTTLFNPPFPLDGMLFFCDGVKKALLYLLKERLLCYNGLRSLIAHGSHAAS